jgi:hypothetical protein
VNGSSLYEAYLSTTVTSSDKTSSLTFSPNLTESGFYEVLLYAPSSCTDCLDVDITIKNGAGTTNVVTVAQDGTESSQSIFNGYFDISSQQPTVTISVSHNATVSSSKNKIMVNSMQFIQQATSDNLTSILQYDTSVTNITTVPWGPLTGGKRHVFICIKEKISPKIFILFYLFCYFRQSSLQLKRCLYHDDFK